MRLHLETLFRRDDAGFLISNNASPPGPAPKFFLGRTPHGNVWALRNDLDESVGEHLATLAGRQAPALESVPEDVWTPYVEVIARAGPISRIWTGPTFRFPALLVPAADTVLVNADNAHILSPLLEDWRDDVTTEVPLLADLVDGRAVSVCRSVRVGRHADEAGVETHPDFRGRGHGARVVAAWAAELRARGRTPLYSTSWANHSSQRLARRLGLVQFGSTFHVT
jgi:GNAT superfamily N-acetyltransferase